MINIITLFTGAILIGITTYIPTWSQIIIGKNASQSGLMLTPLLLLWTCGSFIVGFITGKLKSETTIKLGGVILIISTLLLSTATELTTDILIYLYTGLLGLGMGIIVPLIIVYVQSNVSRKELGSAMGLNAFINTLSQSIGVSIFGAIFTYSSANTRGMDGIEAGIHSIFMGTVVLAILVLVSSFFLKRRQGNKNYSTT